MVNTKFTNNLKGYKALLAWIKEQKVARGQMLVCLENTGLYHRALVAFLQNKQAFVWLENAVVIKWSMGLTRGKSDLIDCQRICLYAFRHQDKAHTRMNTSLQGLADLLATRERLIQAKNSLLLPIKEMQAAGFSQEARRIKNICKASLTSLEQAIKALEKELEYIIDKEEKLKINYRFICSVKGVGMVTALYLLVYTSNSERFTNAKKLACYSGIVPFTYSSGSSIRRRTQVHPMANKTLKTALHMCALSSIRNKDEMRLYYERKIKEGKHKMSILNAIRNKLLHRVYACVRDQRMYVCKQAA